MTAKEKIITEGRIDEICRNLMIPKQDREDLVQEIALVLLEYDDDKVERMYEKNEINYWLTRVIKNNYWSNTSQFYRKFKKFMGQVDMNIITYINEVEDNDREEHNTEFD